MAQEWSKTRPPSRHELPAASAEKPRRKTFLLRQSLIDDAMAILGTRTETETIERALELVVLRPTLPAGVRGMRGAGLVNVFDDDADLPEPDLCA